MENWTDDGQVTFTGKARWWVGFSVESYGGVYPQSNYAYMGNPATVFSANAFGGTNYSNTPVCWVGGDHETAVPASARPISPAGRTVVRALRQRGRAKQAARLTPCWWSPIFAWCSEIKGVGEA